MKTNLYTFLFFVFSGIFTAASQEIDASWQTKATAYIHQQEYAFYADHTNIFHTVNASNHISCTITAGGYSVSHQQATADEHWQVDFCLKSIGRTNASYFFTKPVSVEQQTNNLVYRYEFADVEYLNNEKGLRQNFILKEKPGGDGLLKVKIKLSSTLQPRLVNNSKLVLIDRKKAGDKKLSYEDLKVWDADKKQLVASMELDAERNILSLVINDKNAVYPITIDPLNKTSEWTTSADGIAPALLTNLQLQAEALYGYAVAGLGDINNDGYDDVAISAPGMANVIAGAGNLLSVGAVFIYLGSPSGLSAAPSKILQPNTAVAGALFGFSMDAGDVTGDNIPDIIISAPMDSYNTTAIGLLGDVNVNVTAGKVYVYRSEDLFSAPNPSPFLQLRLQGSHHFSTGVLGLFNNTSVNALFGFSVAVTDDLNSDNKKDIVIGAPAYIGTDLLSVKNGAAFVYYSDNLSTISPVELSVPTPSILGLVSLPLGNLNGLLYGFSVDGAGDYNNDGHPDIVVGAPAGADLSSLGGIFTGQTLGGSAYVYYSNGSSISPAIGASLQGSPSGLLSNTANLFGYKVKGVRNSSGARNGSILISAPSGNVLSNVIGGLRVKAGQVHVFRKKTGSFASPVLSDQALSSPRSSSIVSILAGKTLDLSLLYGAGMDNVRDLNCDGYADIMIGEPLSTTVPMIGANITGGAAYVYMGKADGTYQPAPLWSLYPEVSPLLGINATSLVGFSVAGIGYVKGSSEKPRIAAGGPSNALDFGTGFLNLGNTVGVLNSFVMDNNGLGKAYEFNPDLCNFVTLPVNLVQFGGYAVDKTVQLNWKSLSEDNLAYYELQRSTDNTHFETISLVFAKGGQVNEYAYPDKLPSQGANYYRLKMVNDDSKFSYSGSVLVKFTERLQGTIMAIPNPVRSEFKIQLTGMEKGMYQLKLFNSAGLLMQTSYITVTQQQQTAVMPPVTNYANGMYWLNLYDVSGKKVNEIKVVLHMD